MTSGHTDLRAFASSLFAELQSFFMWNKNLRNDHKRETLVEVMMLAMQTPVDE